MSQCKEPFIGITCDVNIPKDKGKKGFELVCDHRYPEAVKLAGGYPILLPIAFRKDIIRKYLDQVDGLIIVGGEDVDPKLYGEKRKEGTGTIFPARLQFEIKLYREARKREIPILGICYGMQLINVLEGGTLFQDIARDAKSKMRHNRKSHPHHRIRVEHESRLGKILGQKNLVIHSHHHQAVSRVAPKFRPVAFAADGIIEAIECGCEKILAVQWHPERTLHQVSTQRLFKSFISLCSK